MIFSRCLVLLALPLALVSAMPRALLATRDNIQSGGNYTITNVKAAGLAVDISAADNTSIIGYPYHGGSNQKWTFAWISGGWTIKSVGLDKYIGLAGGAAAANGTKLAAVTSPVPWDIWFDTANATTYRFFVHGTTQNWDLSNYGNSTPGTPVQTWDRWAGLHQTWIITTIS